MMNRQNHQNRAILDLIDTLKKKVCEGGEITEQEALQLLHCQSKEEIDHLLEAAQHITHQFHSKKPDLCSLINVKSYLCAEDCAFCAQSTRFQTEAKQYPLLEVDEVLERAKEFERLGIENLCLVTSGGALNDAEFKKILEMIRRIRRQTRLHVDGSLGFLNRERVQQLKEAGLRRFNNNLQCSREFYPQIVTTHSYEKRLETMDCLMDGGLEICSGGILNMGESREDRIRLAFELKPFSPHCLPVNILNPRPGTPLENRHKAAPLEILKTIAVFRFIHPKANIKLAGGREMNLEPSDQEKALKGGANGMVVCGYLTTAGNPFQKDIELLQKGGYEIFVDQQEKPEAERIASERQPLKKSAHS